VAVKGDIKNASNTFVLRVKGEDLVKYIDLDGRIELKYTVNLTRRCGLNLCGSGQAFFFRADTK
jgi:hypothetical protein